VIKLVLALDRRDFLSWCRDHDIDPADRSVKHIRDSQDLRGLGQPVEIEETPRFMYRRDAEYLMADAQYVQEHNKELPDSGPTSR
jgi:hypothetical protein